MNNNTRERGAMNEALSVQRRMVTEQVTHNGGFSAVKLHPLACQAFLPDEGGVVQTQMMFKLAPVSGYLRSKPRLEAFQVFVPYQAIEKLELGETNDDAGVTEMTRRRLQAGAGIGLEDENAISQACFVHPKTIGGTNRVSKTVRLAYIAAVNHLRRMVYWDAAQVPATETAILPAVLSMSVLDRFNAVLDPEQLVDGAINLTGSLPITGISVDPNSGYSGSGASVQVGADQSYVERSDERISFDIGTNGSSIVATMDGTQEITLRDMMKSELIDNLVRKLAKLRTDDPQHGEEKVARAIYGLQCDYGDDCHVLYHDALDLLPQHHQPTDAAGVNEVSGHMEASINASVMVPRSELGGQLVTIVQVKPLEVLRQQPNPRQTRAWALVNRIHDQTELDEQLVTRGELETGVASVDQDTPVFWVGHNRLMHGYNTQGPNDSQIGAVEVQSSMWVYDLPTSVTPENIVYPSGGVDMYPFANWNGFHVEYFCNQRAQISTHMALGPNPVERLQLLQDDPTLVDADA